MFLYLCYGPYILFCFLVIGGIVVIEANAFHEFALSSAQLIDSSIVFMPLGGGGGAVWGPLRKGHRLTVT